MNTLLVLFAVLGLYHLGGVTGLAIDADKLASVISDAILKAQKAEEKPIVKDDLDAAKEKKVDGEHLDLKKKDETEKTQEDLNDLIINDDMDVANDPSDDELRDFGHMVEVAMALQDFENDEDDDDHKLVRRRALFPPNFLASLRKWAEKQRRLRLLRRQRLKQGAQNLAKNIAKGTKKLGNRIKSGANHVLKNVKKPFKNWGKKKDGSKKMTRQK